MPTKVCAICNQLQRLSASDFSYADKSGGDHICSKKCLFDWVRSQKKVLYVTELVGATNGEAIIGMTVNGEGTSYSPTLKMWFRSDYERFFAEISYPKFDILYEAVVFRWVKENGAIKIYLPDFYFVDYGCFVEVKGAWREGSRSKMVAFRKEFPNVSVVVLPWTVSDEFYGGKNE